MFPFFNHVGLLTWLRDPPLFPCCFCFSVTLRLLLFRCLLRCLLFASRSETYCIRIPPSLRRFNLCTQPPWGYYGGLFMQLWLLFEAPSADATVHICAIPHDERIALTRRGSKRTITHKCMPVSAAQNLCLHSLVLGRLCPLFRLLTVTRHESSFISTSSHGSMHHSHIRGPSLLVLVATRTHSILCQHPRESRWLVSTSHPILYRFKREKFRPTLSTSLLSLTESPFPP